ncbi:primosomal protein N' [Campylobacter sp. faydin G-140]|uniref:primosomal protein N' n=1 Tax=Campylobacter anatolicus TaxID=2829105 RepID=UPI001B9FE52F|nr:primosomal protein N' [Campylobacter anatolicus]MBR8464762.1 primosomal protein N' [Campylobacter anatolicus]
MKYYLVALDGLKLNALTYQSEFEIESFHVVRVPLGKKQVLGYVLKSCEKPSFNTLDISEILPLKLTDTQIELAKFISYYYTCEISVVLGLFEPENLEIKVDLPQQSYSITKDINTTKQNKTSLANSISCDNTTKKFNITPNLNDIQTKALNFIEQNPTSLLFGDTGSGKSEVYISAIQRTLNDNAQALFLMPEISLTPQMQTRLESFFGTAVAIWHSKITPKKKQEILKDIANGKIKLIAGARSALFLPLSNLKLIVVDEEHDDSYKNSSRPHYNARDLALFLASKFDLRVILGSATPSLTSFYKQPTFRMRGTFFNSQKSFIYDESETGLSNTLKQEIALCLSNKKQAVICLPTRANFKYLVCKKCGDTIKCPFCSVGMSFYKKQNVLKCQYCDFKTAVPKTCDKCGSEMIEAKKIGTSELLELLQNEFANARIAKFDRDEITTQNKLIKALREFNDGNVDILVGTQMLSKGHDYHSVALAVIMGVDELLNYPDFRSRERTLALAMQVAGRAGRAGVGRVLVQSRQREFFESYIQDYDKFLADDTNFRNELYPPFKRLLRIIISHTNDANAKTTMNTLLSRLAPLTQRLPLEIVGYGKCGVEYIGSKYRYEILIRSSSYAPLIAAANECKDSNVDIDIDPVNFS